MTAQACDGWVYGFAGQHTSFTGKIRIDGTHALRDRLEYLARRAGATIVPRTSRNRRMTLLAVGELTDNVVDPANGHSKSLRYVLAERKRGNHVCVIDESGISALLRGEPAECLDFEAVSAGVVRVRSGREAARRPRQAAPELGSMPTTDIETTVLRRTEQIPLRQQLLVGRLVAPCSLCGRNLPADLLVAAHIQPRRELDDDDRYRFDEIAMLACKLGCDALFEYGYIVVNRQGSIERGLEPDAPDLRAQVDTLVGRRCSAHSPATAERFSEHWRRHRRFG